ncbi:PGPGW domain-containing protein [Patescibacteria group bacterium]|nr:PGPGW domain-containing protein [Patescibacteria group bacterium]
MKSSIKRFFEIAGGSLLILAGILMLFTPGMGILAILAGVMLISPHHGRRLVWWGKQLWRGVKGWWYSFRFKRTIRHSKFMEKARALKNKIKLKK